jgi:hypothetical protein
MPSQKRMVAGSVPMQVKKPFSVLTSCVLIRVFWLVGRFRQWPGWPSRAGILWIGQGVGSGKGRSRFRIAAFELLRSA